MAEHEASEWWRIPKDWVSLPRLSAQEVGRFRERAELSRAASRRYMAKYLVAEDTAHSQVCELAARILQTGTLRCAPSGGPVVASTHFLDGEYTIRVDLDQALITHYRGQTVSWHDRPSGRLSLEQVLAVVTDKEAKLEALERGIERRRLRREQEDLERQRRAQAAAVFPEGAVYTREGRPVMAPTPGEAVSDEVRVRRLARYERVRFHAAALNAEFFARLPASERPGALAGVVEVMLRSPRKGTVTISEGTITVCNPLVVLTFSPDCLAVTGVGAPVGKDRNPPRYKAKEWRYRPDTGRSGARRQSPSPQQAGALE